MKSGEIYWVDLAIGRRPGIVVSRESLNQGNYVVMVLCTTKHLAVRSQLPNCVPFQAGDGAAAHLREPFDNSGRQIVIEHETPLLG